MGNLSDVIMVIVLYILKAFSQYQWTVLVVNHKRCIMVTFVDDQQDKQVEIDSESIECYAKRQSYRFDLCDPESLNKLARFLNDERNGRVNAQATSHS